VVSVEKIGDLESDVLNDGRRDVRLVPGRVRQEAHHRLLLPPSLSTLLSSFSSLLLQRPPSDDFQERSVLYKLLHRLLADPRFRPWIIGSEAERGKKVGEDRAEARKVGVGLGFVECLEMDVACGIGFHVGERGGEGEEIGILGGKAGEGGEEEEEGFRLRSV
jgi:hypothetical protein